MRGWARAGRTVMWPLLVLACLGLPSPGCGGTSCVVEGTRVDTPHGPLPVQSLAVGDIVYSVNPLTGRRVSARITAVRSAWRSCVRVRLGDGKMLRATPDHPCLCPRTGRYTALGALGAAVRPALAVATMDGAPRPVALLAQADEGQRRRVFDLTVDSPYRNFIANGVVVHNKSDIPDPPGPLQDVVASVVDLSTMQPAAFADVAPTLPEGMPTQWGASSDPFVGNTTVIQIQSGAPFDQVVLTDEPAHVGAVVATLASPMMNASLALTVQPGVAFFSARLRLVSAGSYVPGETTVGGDVP